MLIIILYVNYVNHVKLTKYLILQRSRCWREVDIGGIYMCRVNEADTIVSMYKYFI